MSNEYFCTFCGKQCKNKNSHRNHERLCSKNPNHPPYNSICIKGGNGAWNKGLTAKTDERIRKWADTMKQKYSSGQLKPYNKGRKHTEEERIAISNGMKRAHREGRAYNIGTCRWKNEHSWPEKWFIQVIENEFEDKNYKCELPFHRFSLDFAWVEKKRCIEIDGKFHETKEQSARDKEKDRLLESDGWKLLRMPWKEVYKDTKTWIEKARNFIDG